MGLELEAAVFSKRWSSLGLELEAGVFRKRWSSLRLELEATVFRKRRSSLGLELEVTVFRKRRTILNEILEYEVDEGRVELNFLGFGNLRDLQLILGHWHIFPITILSFHIEEGWLLGF